MSRALKKQMLTMIELLEKANHALKVNLTANRMNENGIRQLLSDCQETAAAMGNELEMIFGEGTDLVHKLEEYHESLYQMTLVLRHPGKRYELLKDLTGQINQAKRLLDDLISDRLEAVFLPYNASIGTLWNTYGLHHKMMKTAIPMWSQSLIMTAARTGHLPDTIMKAIECPPMSR